MANFKFTIPETKEIKVGDTVEYNNELHVLISDTKGSECGKCSLATNCEMQKKEKTFCYCVPDTRFELIDKF